MAQFSWTDDLYTGISLIDGDHRKLIELINALFETMESGECDQRMCKAMDDLIAYAKEHFWREETEMEHIGYVAAMAHQAEHIKLLQQLAGLKAMLDAGGKINAPAVSEFLSLWLRDHILRTDMKLAAALNQRRNSEPALQAH
jgi:hemerythrin